MDLENLSIEGISALKQSEIALKVGVKVLKGINEQTEAVAAILFEAISSTPPPESGKGQRLNIVA